MAITAAVIRVRVVPMSWREQVVLGRSGLKVGRLGIGASFGVGAAPIERAFHEYGVNYFYWGSIRRGGMKTAIRNLRSQRDDLVVALQTYDHTGVLMQGSVERGLKSLGVEVADVLIVGWRNARPPPRIMDAARTLVEQGKVKHLAMSGHHRPLFGELAKDPDNPFDIFMVRYNAAHPGAEQDIFPHLSDGAPGVTTYTGTCWGKLLDPKRMPAGDQPMTAADCYRFALSSPHVNLCITGPKDDAQMEHALTALEAGPLSEDETRRIRRIGAHVHGGRLYTDF
jgi:aryl-alcohol dehydrogenase-like predicted oxidoreductase